MYVTHQFSMNYFIHIFDISMKKFEFKKCFNCQEKDCNVIQVCSLIESFGDT